MPLDKRDQIRDFLMRCNVVTRVMATKDFIENLYEFEQFCLETNAKMSEIFPWKDVNNSSHMLFGHVCHVIAGNYGYGLGHLSEGMFQKLDFAFLLFLQVTQIPASKSEFASCSNKSFFIVFQI